MDSKLDKFSHGLENLLLLSNKVVSLTLKQFSVFVYQLRKCEFIKTICNGLYSMPIVENEIVLLKYLITGS